MRWKLLITLFSIISFKGFSQTTTDLKFDLRYTKCEKQWVVITKADTSTSYTYGYIYIDEQAGFTFDLQGVFNVNDKGVFIRDTNAFSKTGSIKYRITPNWRAVAILSLKHRNELNLPVEPDWVKIYYKTKDPVYHNYRMGWIYNDANESEAALIYLKKAYLVNSHTPNVEFEMAYAYNALNRFSEAVELIELALKSNPRNALFYKELGYAYNKLSNYDKAIETYKLGLQYFPNQRSDSRGELAFNMANIYKRLNNQQEYKNWMIKAKEYVSLNSQYHKAIIDAGF
jgi:tetratricopeptide (TPR) repeat protein